MPKFRKSPWKRSVSHEVKTYQFKDNPELIHIIKTGFVDKYIVVYEDAYELHIGETEILTRKQIKKNFNILI